MTKPYRPANGTAGDIFEAEFCERCKHNAEYLETQDGEKSCKIWARAFTFAISDPEYPKEWVKDDGDRFEETARCTAFEAIP